MTEESVPEGRQTIQNTPVEVSAEQEEHQKIVQQPQAATKSQITNQEDRRWSCETEVARPNNDSKITSEEEQDAGAMNTPQGKDENEEAPPLTRNDTNDRPYTVFTGRQKAVIVLVATLGGCFSPFTANIYYPAISTISRDLAVSVSKVNLSITTYMIFQGVAPSFISAVADVRGRRPAYVIGFVLYMAANLGLALNKSYAGLLVLRCLQSCGSSGLIVLQQGTIVDVVTSGERGKYIAITSINSVLAPSVAPIIGGVLAQDLNWHAIFWFLLIASAVYFVPLLLAFPETCRSVVGDGSVRPPKWNRTLLDVSRKKTEDVEEGADTKLAKHSSVPEKGAKKQPINPLMTFTIISDPETALILLFSALIYAGLYAVTTSLTVQFHDIYGLNSTLQGLLFLPQAVGSIFAAVTNSRALDWNFRRHARKAGITVSKNRQTLLDEMPIERARLEIAAPAFLACAVFIIVYGWLLQLRVHIAGPIVLLVFIGYTILAGFACLTVLVVDLHRKRAATATAASNLTRCLLGAGATAVVNPIIEAIGIGWTMTIVGAMFLVTLPLMVLVMMKGIEWRKKRRVKEQKKEELKSQQ